MGKNNKRMILCRNLRCVCKIWRVPELQSSVSVFRKDNIEECEHVTEMIRELSCGIMGFSITEITIILAYLKILN